MAHATIAANFNEAFDIHLHFSAQIAFYLEILGDVLTQGGHFSFRQVFDPGIGADLCGFNDFIGASGANTENVG
jgi:hypothetical protein